MNKKGSFFLATFTVAAVFVFIVFVNMNKERILEESNLVNIGKLPGVAINATLDEEEIKLFLDKSIEYASFNALLKLGEDGGILKEQNCERINGYVIWKDDCYFYDKLEENFFARFKVLFDDYMKSYGLEKINSEWRIDENNKLIIEIKGMIELEYEGARYGFEPDNKYSLDYNFGSYNEILGKANECIRDEELKGISRNNLFEKCRDDKDFKWAIKVEEKYVLFDIAKIYKNLGEVIVKFALPYNQ